jgi:hypothetical protein
MQQGNIRHCSTARSTYALPKRDTELKIRWFTGMGTFLAVALPILGVFWAATWIWPA